MRKEVDTCRPCKVEAHHNLDRRWDFHTKLVPTYQWSLVRWCWSSVQQIDAYIYASRHGMKWPVTWTAWSPTARDYFVPESLAEVHIAWNANGSPGTPTYMCVVHFILCTHAAHYACFMVRVPHTIALFNKRSCRKPTSFHQIPSRVSFESILCKIYQTNSPIPGCNIWRASLPWTDHKFIQHHGLRTPVRLVVNIANNCLNMLVCCYMKIRNANVGIVRGLPWQPRTRIEQQFLKWISTY